MSGTTHSNAAAAARGCGASGGFGALSGIAASHPLRVAAGHTIFRKGDPANGCYLILEGAVKVTVPADGGREALLAILGKGDVVGEMALLDHMPRSATVVAVRDCVLSHISSARFERLARADVELYRQLLRVLTARLRAGNEARYLHQMPMRARLARALMHLAHNFGERLPDRRVLIRHKVSQAELAHMIGAARENVNRQLTEWRRGRLLSRISGYYCLENPSAFEPLARDEAR
jgi:CRP-like cAMP-binding protein